MASAARLAWVGNRVYAGCQVTVAFSYNEDKFTDKIKFVIVEPAIAASLVVSRPCVLMTIQSLETSLHTYIHSY